MSPKDTLEILKKDWDSLSNFLKFCYVVSVFILAAEWVFKSSGSVSVTKIKLKQKASSTSIC